MRQPVQYFLGTLAELDVTPAAAREPGWLTDRLEREKTEKHGRACTRIGMTFTPAAFTTYGGWGKVVYGKLDEE